GRQPRRHDRAPGGVLVSALEQVDRRTEAPRGGRYEAHVTKRDRLKVRIACLAGRDQRHAVGGARGAWVVQVEERQAAGEQGNLAVVAEDLLPLRAGGVRCWPARPPA